jgi:hypothetical protein
MNVIAFADRMASESACSEQCTPWRLAIVPGVPARAMPTGRDAIRF